MEGLENAKELAGWDEVEIMTVLRDAGPRLPGYKYICHFRDSFVVKASYGFHTCVVLEPMGPSVHELAATFSIPLRLVFTKRMARHVLLTLDFLHQVGGIVHTGKSTPSPRNFPHRRQENRYQRG